MMHLIERTDQPLNRIACAAYDAVGWAEPRLRKLESDRLVFDLIRAAIRRLRRLRAVLAAIPWEVPS